MNTYELYDGLLSFVMSLYWYFNPDLGFRHNHFIFSV